MGFSKNDFEKVDLRIKKITEQTVEQIEIDSELPPTIEQLEDNEDAVTVGSYPDVSVAFRNG